MSEAAAVKRGRGRPRKVLLPVAPEANIEEEFELRERIVKMGIMTAEVAAQMDIETIRGMLDEGAEIGLPADTHAPAPNVSVKMAAAEIIRGLLDMLQVRSAGGQFMDNCCKSCELKPEYLKQECVCQQARKFLAMSNGN